MNDPKPRHGIDMFAYMTFQWKPSLVQGWVSLSLPFVSLNAISPIAMTNLNPFHLAIPVDDLAACRSFYSDVLGCPEGRSDSKWVDFDFFGHQLVIHQVGSKSVDQENSNPVDGKHVPIPHFGIVLEWTQWHALAENLRGQNVKFTIEPHIRFEGQIGEQATMFFLDPAGNALEFKSFKSPDQLFAK
jgi:uncharacterized protein